MSTYLAYCRKSSESEERQALSIESQIKELKELAHRQRLDVAEFLTESQSAKYPGRPVFNDMTKRLSKGAIKGVICWKLDRLARNPIDGATLIWALDQGKVSEIVTPYGVLRNNSNDKFLMQLEFGMAKKYVDDLSDNIRRGNRAKLERGWLPGLPPLGYLNEPKERTIVKDPARFLLVRNMWDLLLRGIGPSQILKTADEEWGFRTRILGKTGGKPLTPSGLYSLFGNPFYYGLIERKDGVSMGKHEPMITEEEYWKAQEMLGRKGIPRAKHHQFAFTGLIRCAECGSMITAEEKQKKSGRHYAYYRCTKKKKAIACRQKYLSMKDMEAQIAGYLRKIHVPERLLTLAIDYLKGKHEEEKGKHHSIDESLEQARKDCERKLDNLNQMRLADLIDDREYLKEKRRLLDQKLQLEESARARETHLRDACARAEEAFSFAHRAAAHFQAGTLEDKRQLLQKIGSNFLLKDKNLIIQAKKAFRIIEEGLRVVGPGIEALELPKNVLIPAQNGLSFSQILSWWSRVEDVRTFFLEDECSKHANMPR
jgi:DNA invertase Pin-like site-specific DNA recombinase